MNQTRSRYKENKAAAVTFNTEPTKTDQSLAANTDINIIVTQFLRTGQVAHQQEPIYGDFTELPEDLRGMIELGRSIKSHKDALPPQLKGIPLEELVNMTNEQINDKLKPADKPADKPTEEKAK